MTAMIPGFHYNPFINPDVEKTKMHPKILSLVDAYKNLGFFCEAWIDTDSNLRIGIYRIKPDNVTVKEFPPGGLQITIDQKIDLYETPKGVSYYTALADQYYAELAYKRASDRLQEVNSILEAAKRELDIECATCHETTKVKDIEIVATMSGGYQSYDHGEWQYRTDKCWVCKHCTTPQSLPSETEGPFEKKPPFKYGFDHYVKAVHKWYSDRERCHGRVLQLLGPHLQREDERLRLLEKERKIQEAKKLLADEGIIGNT